MIKEESVLNKREKVEDGKEEKESEKYKCGWGRKMKEKEQQEKGR